MDLGWICCFVKKSDRIVLAGWIVSAGSYHWILLDLDCIGWIGWIGLTGLDWIIMAG